MFVDIENPKTPLKVTNILTAYDKGVVVKGVRQPPKKLTPEVYPRCIRDILQLIAKLPDEEQVQFKDVVLACFDNREQPTDIFQLGQELAEKSGYGIDFAKAQKFKEGEYLFSDATVRKGLMCPDSEFTDEDFSAYDKVMFLSDKKIQFSEDVKFPKNMEFPNSPDVSFYDDCIWRSSDLQGVQGIRFKDGAKVNLRSATNLPHNLDVSKCAYMNLSGCDLFNQLNLRFKDGAVVDLWQAKNLPKNLDFSQCDEVDLSYCDLSEQPNLRFKDGAKVKLEKARNLPANIDFSQCDEVDLTKCDLQGVQSLRFKDGAKVSLYDAKNLPVNLDVSCCDEVNLGWCDLSEQSNLRFKDGAKVDLYSAENLPANLDFSMCSKVNLTVCRFGAVKELVFKNRQQMEDSCAEFPDDWKGKLVFADEQPEPPALGLAMSAKAKGGR